MPIGRPKTNETNLTIRVTNETQQLLAALATAEGTPLETYIAAQLSAHLLDKKDHPSLAKWYAINYPLINIPKTIQTLELATKRGKK